MSFRACRLASALAVLLALPAAASADATPSVSVAGCVTREPDGAISTFTAQVSGIVPQFVNVFAQGAVPNPADTSTLYRTGYGYVDGSGSVKVDGRFGAVPPGLASIYVTVRSVQWGDGIIAQARVPVCGADDTPPAEEPAVTGTLGADGWYTSDVGISWLVTDPESDLTSTDGCGAQTLTTDTTGTTFTCAATSGGGTSSASVTVKRDATPPVLSLPGGPVVVEAADAHGATATYTAGASDATSGTDGVQCSPSSGSAFPLGDTTVSCKANDAAGNEASGTFTVRVADTTAPKLTLPSDLAATATSAQGAKVTYAASATDTVDGTVPVTCSPASGAQFAPGTTTVTCTATDRAGNTATGTFRVSVTYAWGGFDEPLRNDALTGNAGRTVPLKFSLTGPSAKLGVARAIVLLGRQGQALSPVATDSVSKGDFHYNLSTKGLAPGVYTVRVDLGDGVRRDATLTLT